MYCTQCGNEVNSNKKFCSQCGHGISFALRHPLINKIIHNLAFQILVGIVGFILLFSGVIAVKELQEYTAKEEARNIVLDSLNGTQTASRENAKYTEVVRKMFDEVRNLNGKLMELDKQVGESDMFELSSLKTKTSINNYIGLLSSYIEEINKIDANYEGVKTGIRSKLVDSGLSESEIDGVVEGFNLAVNDPRLEDLRRDRNKALLDYAVVAKEFYVFHLDNFTDYQILKDEYAEEQIYFGKDENIDEYNRLTYEIATKYEIFAAQEKEFTQYANDKLNRAGAGMSAEQLNSLIYK